MKKILITGGSGFLGRSLAIKLKDRYEIILGARNNGLNKKAESLTGCKSIPLDVSSYDSVNDALNQLKPEIIIHAAATKYVEISEEHPNECIDVNILGSQNVARSAIDRGIETVLGISTDKTAPPIGNIYGLSKAVMERMFTTLNEKSETNFSCVRFGNIAWSTGSVFPIWKSMMEEIGMIESTGPRMRRFFFSINEASDLVIRALENIDLCSGGILSKQMKSAQISDILDIWCELYDTTWKEIDSRPGDKEDEYLIGELEIQNTKKIKLDDQVHYLINFNSTSETDMKEPLSSKNSEKMSKKDIKELIKLGF
tara:strand:- start:504 stop:1442 length:939 start_codon:yes stop_codon:yes gene_type:complete